MQLLYESQIETAKTTNQSRQAVQTVIKRFVQTGTRYQGKKQEKKITSARDDRILICD